MGEYISENRSPDKAPESVMEKAKTRPTPNDSDKSKSAMQGIRMTKYPLPS